MAADTSTHRANAGVIAVCAIGGSWGLRASARAATVCGGRWEFAYSVGGLTSLMREASPRFVFFLNWSRTVPHSVLSATIAVNFHCTALPYGRGGHPIENLLLHGWAETVITAHQMTSEIDAGPIYGVSEPFSLAGTKDQIRERFIQPTADLMAKIALGELSDPQPQQGEPVYFKRLSEPALRAFWASRERAA